MSLTAVLYGVLGFLLGFLSGTVWRNAKPAAVTKTTGRKQPRPRHLARERWIGPVVLLLAILMGVQYMVQVNRERDTSRCQSQFNQAFAKQLTIRSELASQAQANVDQIILAVGRLVNPAPSAKAPTAAEQKKAAAAEQKKAAAEQKKAAAEYRQLFKDFAKESAAISDKRKHTPLPKLPVDGCGADEPTAQPVSLALEQAKVEMLERQLDAQRAAILNSEDPSVMAPTDSAAPVRTVVVQRRTPAPVRTEPNDKPTRVVVNMPKSEPAPVPPVVQPISEQVCTLNLLGVCIGL